VALVISSALFSLFHAANANVGVVALLNIFVAGFLLGINYVYTRNIWFAVCLHFSWNFFQGPVLGYEVSGLDLPSLLQQTLKGPGLLTGGEFGFEGSLICLLLNMLTCIFLASYYAGYRTRSSPGFKH
jgi:membrane protease YdiL (CAAX protease family)